MVLILRGGCRRIHDGLGLRLWLVETGIARRKEGLKSAKQQSAGRVEKTPWTRAEEEEEEEYDDSRQARRSTYKRVGAVSDGVPWLATRCCAHGCLQTSFCLLTAARIAVRLKESRSRNVLGIWWEPLDGRRRFAGGSSDSQSEKAA